MNKNAIFLTIAMTLTMIATTSCKEDYYDEERYEQMMRNAFPVASVDPQHTWSTIGSVELFLQVNTKRGKNYVAKIYDQNPIGATNLTQLGEGQVYSGGSLKTTINYPLYLDVLYLALFDEESYMTVYPLVIEDGKASLQVGGDGVAASARSTRAISHQFEFQEVPADTAYHTTLPEDAVDISRYSEFGKQQIWWPEYSETPARFQSFYVDPQDGNRHLQLDHGLADVYVKPGNHKFSLYVLGDVRMYLLPGAHVTFENELNQNNIGFKLYVCKGATLSGPQGISYNFWLYNQGTVTTTRMTQYATGGIMNQGTLDISGHLQIANAASQVVNAGRLTAASMSVEGSSHFLNLDSMTVSGETTVNSNNCSWVNNGYYETQDYKYTAGSTDVVNNCHLVVHNLFYIGLGDTDRNSFQLDGGASVLAKTFQFAGPGFIHMGSGSLFRVTDKAQFSINKDTYGIYGPATGEYAVFQAKAIERLNAWEVNQGFSANYFNHLYVACDSHFDFGYSDKSAEQQAAGEVGSQPYYRLDAASGAQMTTYNGADVHVTDNQCGADYDGTPAEVPEAESFSLRYCFEDNFPEMGDYDLNDAVITVTPDIDGTTTVKLRVSLDAVGATKQIAAALRIKGLSERNVIACTRDGNMDADFPTNASMRIIDTEEVMLPRQIKTSDDVVLLLFNNAHWSLGRTISSVGSVENVFLNTVARDNPYEAKRNDVEPAVVTFTLTLNDATKLSLFTQDNLDVFIVESYNGGYWEVHTVPFKTDEVLAAYYKNIKDKYDDNIPWAICVPGNDFKYPNEWQCIGIRDGGVITGAYQEFGHSFAEWAEDHTKATDWYKYPTEGLVYE